MTVAFGQKDVQAAVFSPSTPSPALELACAAYDSSLFLSPLSSSCCSTHVQGVQPKAYQGFGWSLQAGKGTALLATDISSLSHKYKTFLRQFPPV